MLAAPAAAPPASGATRWTRLALAAVIIGAIALRIRFLAVPLERDEGEYAYLGQLILDGGVPYRDAVNMKLPGVYLAYAALMAVFGQSTAGVRLGLIVVNAATILLLYTLARRWLTPIGAVSAAAVFAAFSLSRGVLGFIANTEHFVVLPALAGLVLAGRALDRSSARAAFAAGLTLGLAVLAKQHGAAFAGFALGYLGYGAWRRREAPRRIAVLTAALAIGTILPYAIVCVALAATGTFERFWFWTVTYARWYATMTDAASGWTRFTAALRVIANQAPPLFLIVLAGLSTILWDRHSRTAWRWLLPFLAASLAAVAPGLVFRPHYFVLALPAAAMAAGLFVESSERLIARFAPRLARTVVVAGLAMTLAAWGYLERPYLFSYSPQELSLRVYPQRPFVESVQIANYLHDHTSASDRIAVLGSEPQIYFYAHRAAATTFVYTYALMEPHPYAPDMQRQMIAEIERARPAYFVYVDMPTSWSTRPDSHPEILTWTQSYIAQHGTLVGALEQTPDHLVRAYWDAQVAHYVERPESQTLVYRYRN